MTLPPKLAALPPPPQLNNDRSLTIPKIEAGKMTKIVRDVIKGVQSSKQDIYEEKMKELKPITEKLEKEIDQISELREETKKMQVVPYSEQVKKLALPGPSGEQQPKIVSDMNKGFTDEELTILQNK